MTSRRTRSGAPAWGWLLLPLVVSALTRDLWAPDEPRYAEVAREIVERGDWLVMHLAGAVYPDKPPLLFWLSALLGWAGGWWPPLMRMVSLAASAGVAWLTGRIARRAWGNCEASWAPVLVLGTAMWTEIGGRLQIDPLLALLSTAALTALWGPAANAAAAARRLRWAGLSVGLALLAKGPVAFVLVGLPLAAMRLLAGPQKAPRPPRRAWIEALVLALAPGLLWAAFAVAREPLLARELFYGQHLERVVQGKRHPGPFWRPAMRHPLLMLPWTAVVLAGLAAAWRQFRARRRGGTQDAGLLRAAAWWLALFVFFSAIPVKRDLYLLPAYPAAALLGARALAVGRQRGRVERALAWSALPALALAGAVLVAAGVSSEARVRLGEDLAWRGPLAGAALLAAAAAAALAWRQGGLPALARRLAQGWALGGAVALTLTLPALDRAKSPRPLALRLAARPERPAAIPCLGVQPEGYRFYGRVPATRDHDLAAALERDGQDFLALVRAEHWKALPAGLRSRLRIAETARVGSRRIHILVAAAPR